MKISCLTHLDEEIGFGVSILLLLLLLPEFVSYCHGRSVSLNMDVKVCRNTVHMWAAFHVLTWLSVSGWSCCPERRGSCVRRPGCCSDAPVVSCASVWTWWAKPARATNRSGECSSTTIWWEREENTCMIMVSDVYLHKSNCLVYFWFANLNDPSLLFNEKCFMSLNTTWCHLTQRSNKRPL